ncbi:MAG TPA: flavohemoglobin expression-modulating QEGLA motif protein [Patescibacteria group bacterium]|nr:flavohemoglobin expression-modulating QEGLA motif protein [Patescibacteria group bacterium]
MHDPADLAYFAALDRRLVVAVRGIRLLEAISWPASVQRRFLDEWRAGRLALPRVEYEQFDLSDVRAELDAIQHEALATDNHPVGGYVRRTAESWEIATRLLESIGTRDVSVHSAALFGKPGDFLPGSDYHNIDAAEHFIALADELSRELATVEADYVISASTMREELQDRLDAFFVHHKVRVEIDPKLTAKAAAGTTRIRLRDDTGFTEYDRHQLLEHEAFVHSLTALNGRAQPHLASMARNSPRITATQEGLATFAELITGAIDIQRMKRISLRILAIDKAQSGADFIEVFRFFLDSGQTEHDSFASAARIFRGVPVEGGAAFTKDTVYLHGLLSVHTFFRWALKNQKLKLCRNLFAGKMTLHDVIALEPWFDTGYIAAPVYLPPWVQKANGLAGMLAFSLFANKIRLDRVEAFDLTLGA